GGRAAIPTLLVGDSLGFTCVAERPGDFGALLVELVLRVGRSRNDDRHARRQRLHDTLVKRLELSFETLRRVVVIPLGGHGSLLSESQGFWKEPSHARESL